MYKVGVGSSEILELRLDHTKEGVNGLLVLIWEAFSIQFRKDHNAIIGAIFFLMNVDFESAGSRGIDYELILEFVWQHLLDGFESGDSMGLVASFASVVKQHVGCWIFLHTHNLGVAHFSFFKFNL